jgi:hypothetical protein
MQEFLIKLNEMLTTPNPTVTFTQTSATGAESNIQVASHAGLIRKVNDIDSKFNSLLGANGNRITVTSNGVTKSFELQDIASVIKDLNAVSSKSLVKPEYFNVKTNWFFESFLSPLIYIDLDVSNIITSDVDKFEITRVIILNTLDNFAYFDTVYKGQTNILYTTALADLTANSIGYTIDVNEQSLPPARSRNSGNFQIIGINTARVSTTDIIASSIITTNSYTLDTIRYSKYIDGLDNPMQETLAINDILIT